MNPQFASWLLAIPYLLSGVGVLAVAWIVGGIVCRLLNSDREGTDSATLSSDGAGVFLLAVRTAAGLGAISWSMAVLGVSGQFRVLPALSLLAAISGIGAYCSRGHNTNHLRLVIKDMHSLAQAWAKSPPFYRLILSLLVLITVGFFYIIVIGALVPDMNQDPMWYHLSVAQQWALSGRFDVYPEVMPSGYSLGTEGLFALLLLMGANPAMCSLLVSSTGVLLIAASVAATILLTKHESKSTILAGAVGAAGIWIPLLLQYGLTAPVQPKNDIPTALWVFCGMMVLWIPLLTRQWDLTFRDWILAGLLLAMACSAKPSMLPVSFIGFTFAALLNGFISKRKMANTAVNILLFLLAMGLVLTPWMIRGYLSHGIPLYPIGRSWFSLSPQYEPMVEAFERVNGVVQARPGALLEAISDFPQRLRHGARNGEKVIFLYGAVVLLGVLAMKGRLRWYSVMLMCQLTLLFAMRGSVEVFRFFSPVYWLAIPLFASLVTMYSGRLRFGIRWFALVATWAMVLFSVGWHQYRISRFYTFDWEFRPVLSAADVDAYAQHAEMGSLYLNFKKLQPYIDEGERVLLFDVTYPFYLHRNTLWNDEIVKTGGWLDRWKTFDAVAAGTFLKERDIDTVLYAPRHKVNDEIMAPVLALERQGKLIKQPMPEELAADGWGLWQVAQTDTAGE